MELLPIPKAVALFLWPCNTQCPAHLQADLPLVDGRYEWADGKSVSAYDSTVVAVHADSGFQQNAHVGYGEVVPLGPNYLASYAAGVRTGIAELAPKLIGRDPTQVWVINNF